MGVSRVSGHKLTKYQGLLLITQVTGGPRANRELVMGIVFRVMREERKHVPHGTG